eukprot:2174070-Rhodomonas_salina.1
MWETHVCNRRCDGGVGGSGRALRSTEFPHPHKFYPLHLSQNTSVMLCFPAKTEEKRERVERGSVCFAKRRQEAAM